MTGEMNAYERLHFGHHLSFRGGLLQLTQHDQNQIDKGGGGNGGGSGPGAGPAPLPPRAGGAGGGKRRGPLMNGMSGLESWESLHDRRPSDPSVDDGVPFARGKQASFDTENENAQMDNLRGQDPNRGADTRTQPKWWIGMSRSAAGGAAVQVSAKEARANARQRMRTEDGRRRSLSQADRTTKPRRPAAGGDTATRRSTSIPTQRAAKGGSRMYSGMQPYDAHARTRNTTAGPGAADAPAEPTGQRAGGFQDAETNRLLRLKFEAGNGNVRKMRYVSCEGLGWAYVSTPGSANPISEVKCFRFMPDTRQLLDQNGIGGVLPEYHLSRRLKEIVAFASYCMIAHNITLPVGRGVLNMPTQAPRIMPRYNHPTSPWDVFTSWLGGGPMDEVVAWTAAQGGDDLDIQGERLVVARGRPATDRACVLQNPVRGSVVYEMAVVSGVKGINFGVVCGETPRLRRALTVADGACVYGSIGEVWRDGRELIGAAAYSAGDVITLHINADTGTVFWARNGVRQHATFTKLQGPFYVVVGMTEPGTTLDVRAVAPDAHSPRLPTPMSQLDTDADTARKQPGSGVISRTMITTTLKSSSRTLVGPVDLYLPAGCTCTVSKFAPRPGDTSPGYPIAAALTHERPLQVHIERMTPKWSEALPEQSDFNEPHRTPTLSLSPHAKPASPLASPRMKGRPATPPRVIATTPKAKAGGKSPRASSRVTQATTLRF